MAIKNKKAFTLVELLAVIVILAVILVIAVPSIMDTIKESRKGALASSAKLIASSAETAYISNQTLGIEEEITCEDVSSYNSNDDFTCDLKIKDGKAKVTLIGKGKFEGMAVCGGTKEEAEVKMKNSCPAAPVSFTNDSWETIADAVKDENTSKYNVGDTKTVNLGALGEHTLRIANMSACPTGASALASETACGFVVEFADIITEHNMNPGYTDAGGWPASTNAGGWPGSELYSYVNGVIYNALPEDLTNIIIKTKVVSSHGSKDANNFESEDYLYLLSPEEVYGSVFTISSYTARETSRQLDYYNGKITSSDKSAASKYYGSGKNSWWFRSATSNESDFFRVHSDGDYSNYEARVIHGVSPAFRLG